MKNEDLPDRRREDETYLYVGDASTKKATQLNEIHALIEKALKALDDARIGQAGLILMEALDQLEAGVARR
jgi:hypothetical protein